MNDAVTCPENKIDPTTDALMGNREISMLIFLHAILFYFIIIMICMFGNIPILYKFSCELEIF